MADISNRTLVGLLVVAIVVSLAGTFVSLNKLGGLSDSAGAATSGDGTVSLEVTANAELTLRVTSIDFGAAKVNGSGTGVQYCSLVSQVNASMPLSNTFNADSAVATTECLTPTNGPLTSFIIENTGNTAFLNVTVNSSAATTYAPILGGDGSNDGFYGYKAHEESTACSNFATAQTGFTAFTTAPVTVCDDFQTGDGQNAFALQVNVSIPEHANATASTPDTISFIGNV